MAIENMNLAMNLKVLLDSIGRLHTTQINVLSALGYEPMKLPCIRVRQLVCLAQYLPFLTGSKSPWSYFPGTCFACFWFGDLGASLGISHFNPTGIWKMQSQNLLLIHSPGGAADCSTCSSILLLQQLCNPRCFFHLLKTKTSNWIVS